MATSCSRNIAVQPCEYLTFFYAFLLHLTELCGGGGASIDSTSNCSLSLRLLYRHGALSIGMWHSVFLCYGVLAVMTNSAIICFRTSILGDDISTTSKVWLFFIFQYIIFGTIVAVAVIIPGEWHGDNPYLHGALEVSNVMWM